MNKLVSNLMLSVFAIVGICMIESCSKTSTTSACIGTIPSTASAGVTVSFRSCTVGASSYKWSFGDGVTDTGQTAIHIYATAGTYTGTLTVTQPPSLSWSPLCTPPETSWPSQQPRLAVVSELALWLMRIPSDLMELLDDSGKLCARATHSHA